MNILFLISVNKSANPGSWCDASHAQMTSGDQWSVSTGQERVGHGRHISNMVNDLLVILLDLAFKGHIF